MDKDGVIIETNTLRMMEIRMRMSNFIMRMKNENLSFFSDQINTIINIILH